MRQTRRHFITGSVAATVAAATAREVAAQQLIPFGAAVMISEFRSDQVLRDHLAKLCDVIVPMNELKWDWVRQDRAGFRFENADEIIGFARQNGKAVHGHALLWHEAMPEWAKNLSSAREAERELIRHIETVVGKYAGVVGTWDVINEVTVNHPKPGATFRDSVWFRLLGPRMVDIAFQTAARTDPKAKLLINDYNFENPDEATAARRLEVIRLVRHLQDRNIPVHQVGMQAHLYGERQLDRRGITAFCRELGRFGVGVRVTELDVIDWKLPAAIAERDRIVADLTASYLSAVIEGQRPDAIVTWGLTDKSTWVNDVFKRTDRARARPLPLDEAYRPKPMMAAIQAARRLKTPPA